MEGGKTRVRDGQKIAAGLGVAHARRVRLVTRKVQLHHANHSPLAHLLPPHRVIQSLIRH
jgi:hypothetical protein